MALMRGLVAGIRDLIRSVNAGGPIDIGVPEIGTGVKYLIMGAPILELPVHRYEATICGTPPPPELTGMRIDAATFDTLEVRYRVLHGQNVISFERISIVMHGWQRLQRTAVLRRYGSFGTDFRDPFVLHSFAVVSMNSDAVVGTKIGNLQLIP